MTEAYPRRSARFLSEGKILVDVLRPLGRQQFWGLIANLGRNGLAATVTGELNEQEVVTLHFSALPSQPEVSVRGRVCHREGYRYGFEFLRLNQSERECINRACAELARRVGAH